ncbi:hypothetical protein GCM10017635_11460 [Paracoccus kondratievae]|uniref:Transposase n=1 Tax=Paracoccus kondratievae TaxID=135740 RepID=A0AAD3RTC7_9RHOB|nr:hypothetical protein GCM10017635_11460 [Paracoccus kondratievae]
MELALAEGVPTKTHVLNLLHRLVDGKVVGGPPLDTPHALALRREPKAIWKRWSGYHVRSRIEARMRCLKAFGERISSRDPDRQTAEIHIRIALMNRFNALGSAEIKRVA